ncbi:hypothetical protein P7K49_014834 [Saguinus oedipus]|uniref:Uncharacterized protein n=1 Tax=Saguinus oedipus TaxID=9490 RepID=A0ABQ9V7K9_SAGOE|nr:hypothetical protein P7K49_014834 [Saguinus oedipus]
MESPGGYLGAKKKKKKQKRKKEKPNSGGTKSDSASDSQEIKIQQPSKHNTIWQQISAGAAVGKSLFDFESKQFAAVVLHSRAKVQSWEVNAGRVFLSPGLTHTHPSPAGATTEGYGCPGSEVQRKLLILLVGEIVSRGSGGQIHVHLPEFKISGRSHMFRVSVFAVIESQCPNAEVAGYPESNGAAIRMPGPSQEH